VTTLVIEKLQTELFQEVRYNNSDRVHVGAFIPYLYLHNAQADYFTFELEKDSVVLFSKNFTVSEIKSALPTTDNYIHVFYPIIPSNPVQIESGLYKFKLIAGTNYINSPTSFIGWIKQHEDIQNQMDYIPVDDSQNSFSIRYKSYKEGIE
jgi:hypothetical protein